MRDSRIKINVVNSIRTELMGIAALLVLLNHSKIFDTCILNINHICQIRGRQCVILLCSGDCASHLDNVMLLSVVGENI